MRGESDVFRRYWHDEQGAISVLAAFVLVAVVGVSALALEYGHGLLQKVENQRAADLAAYGGALVYNSTGSSDSATSAASNIAALNGLSSGVTPSYVSSPSGDGNHAIEVTATTNLPLELARVLTSNTTLPVSATAYAEINSSAPGCIIALNSGGTGIVADGGHQHHREQLCRGFQQCGDPRRRAQLSRPKPSITVPLTAQRGGAQHFTTVRHAICHLQPNNNFRPAERQQRGLDRRSAYRAHRSGTSAPRAQSRRPNAPASRSPAAAR